MNPLAALAIAGGLCAIYCGLVLWGSSRREAARAAHVQAQMDLAVADCARIHNEITNAKFDRIIADGWNDQ